MKDLNVALISVCLLTAAGTSFAQDTMKKDPMADPMKKPPTMKECKDFMTAKKDNMKPDDTMVKMEAQCKELMKKDGMMKKDSAASMPMGK